MTVTLGTVKKSVTVGFPASGPSDPHGGHVACEFGAPDGELIEKKNIRLRTDGKGRGHATFTVDNSFSGAVKCRFTGSLGGSAEGTVHIP